MKIHIPPQRQKKFETIHASIENTGNKPVTFCIEVGQTSPKGGGETETTPSPFWVQRNDNGKWDTLMIGPDVGSLKTREVLGPGKSMEFPFRLGESGQMRVRLSYWKGSLPSLDCHAPPKRSLMVTSAVFTIVPITPQIDDSGIQDPMLTATDVASFPKRAYGKLTGVVSSNESLATLIVSLSKVGSTAAASTQKLNDAGSFTFADLEPGDYLMTITDFKSCVRFKTTVRVESGKIRNLSIGQSQMIQPTQCSFGELPAR